MAGHFLLLCLVAVRLYMVNGQGGCDRNFTANDIDNTISSPNYPGSYPSNIYCTFTIIFDNPTDLFDISLYVSNFRTYLYRSYRDSVIINNRYYYGDGATQPTALRTGQTYTYRYRGSMVIRFDARTPRSAQGFSISYFLEPNSGANTITEACNAVSCGNGGTCHSHGPGDFRCYCQTGYFGDRCQFVPNTHDCPKFYNLDGTNMGAITSTYYPSRYPNSHYCDMFIYNVTIGQAIEIYVNDFQTETRHDVLCIGSTERCYSGDGRTSGGALRVGRTYVYPVTEIPFRLAFNTDRSVTRRGFQLTYLTVDSSQLNITTPGRTNKGTEFTLAFLPQRQNSLLGNTRLLITSEYTTNAMIHVGSRNTQIGNYTVGPLTPLTVELDNRFRTTEGLEDKGITVLSKENITVVAYSSTGSQADGMLILPEANLGTQHVIASYTPAAGSYSYVTVIGNENLTDVWFVQRNESYDEDGGYDYEKALRVQVYDKQTYTLKSPVDLTGMKVVSNRPISVISGCDFAQVPENVDYGDHLTEMLPSVRSLGFDFIIAPIAERVAGEVVRVISWTDDTFVTVPGGFQTELDEGMFTELDNSGESPTLVMCSKKCLVVQYNKGRSADGKNTGPFMVVIPPISQYTQNHIFSVPQGYGSRAYINVVINSTWANGLQFSGTNVSHLTNWIEVPNFGYSIAQIQLSTSETVMTLGHPLKEAEWSAVLYGHGQSRGFGYSLGMQLDAIEPRATEPPKVTDPPVTAPPGNITERCRCNIRVIGNESAGEAEFGTLVHDLEDILYFYSYEDCEACLTTLQNCPSDCREEVLDQWGTLGLASEIIIATPRGPRAKALGQLMCERHYLPINPPGRKLAPHYRAGNCMTTEEDAPLFIGRVTAGPYLCCAEVDVPIVGKVPSWDINCDGQPGYLKDDNMINILADELADHGLDPAKIKAIIEQF